MNALPQRRRMLAFPLLFLALASVFALLFATTTTTSVKAPVTASQPHAKPPATSHVQPRADICPTASVGHVRQVSAIVLRCVHAGPVNVWRFVTTAHVWHVWHVHHLLHLRYLHNVGLS
jgi:hypothetical protein